MMKKAEFLFYVDLFCCLIPEEEATQHKRSRYTNAYLFYQFVKSLFYEKTLTNYFSMYKTSHFREIARSPKTAHALFFSLLIDSIIHFFLNLRL